MSEKNESLNPDEQLRAENDFIKMKLMLEKGASFGEPSGEIPPEIENVFLRGVMETEKIFDEGKMIRIGDKVGRPKHFRPESEIPESEIENAWDELRKYMNAHAVDLDVCSPNVSARELYRFTLEELFEYETTDLDLPGWTTNFIYDEFHPDPVYNNARMMTDVMREILQKEALKWTHDFEKDSIRLNGHYPLDGDGLKTIVNRYKSAYDELEPEEIEHRECILNDNLCEVQGAYHLNARSGKESFRLGGNWKAILKKDEETGYWNVSELFIEGINF